MLKPFYFEDFLEASIDEAGLGCIAGPVVAAAVIWPHPESFEKEHIKELEMLNDSKKLTKKRREHLRKFVEHYAIAYSVEFINVETIDDINIYHARFKAMHNAIKQLDLKPERLIIDGDKFTPFVDPETNEVIPHVCVIKGDGKYQGIAAASVLAKTYRDEYMESLSEKFPDYGWESNKGYGTAAHYSAVKTHGPSEHHRKSFNLHLNEAK